jgi:hypothetical protein
VTLFENPIFITQKRLVHRAGVMALLLGIVLIGLCMLCALYYHLISQRLNTASELQAWHETPGELGHDYYAWVLVIQGLVLIVGGFSRISRTLVEERKAGLLDSNRLTPLSGADLVMGYWLGSALREFYLAAALVPVGLGIILMTGLPLSFWIGTQLLLFSTALFFGMLAVLAGMAMPRAQGGIGIVVALLFLMPMSITAGSFSLTNFVAPVYATVQMFDPSPSRTDTSSPHWDLPAGLYGIGVPAPVYTLAVQIILGCLACRGAVRKFGNPNRPAFVRSEMLVLYGLLVFLQYGLVWGWRHSSGGYDRLATLCALHGCVLFLGVIMLTPQLLRPEEARIAAIQDRAGAFGRVLWESGPCTAIALTAIACAGLLTQYVSLRSPDGLRYLVVAVNTLVVFLTFSILLEVCRLLFRRKAISFFALALFVFYGLPFVLSLCFQSSKPMEFSILAPGVSALAGEDLTDFSSVRIVTIVHLVIVIALAGVWMFYWKRWLGRAMTSSPS